MLRELGSKLANLFLPERRNPASWSPGQQALLREVRLHRNKEMGNVIEEASLDDLEWFVQMLELQLEETPHWVNDNDRLHEIQAWTRHVRTMTTGILHNKRVAQRRRRLFRTSLWSLVLVVFGWALGKYFG